MRIYDHDVSTTSSGPIVTVDGIEYRLTWCPEYDPTGKKCKMFAVKREDGYIFGYVYRAPHAGFCIEHVRPLSTKVLLDVENEYEGKTGTPKAYAALLEQFLLLL